jgi:nucleoside-diphosphate-sugar epimerase
MQVLVTGGAGYIGSVLVDKLLTRGDKVCCLDLRAPTRPQTGFSSSSNGFSFMQGDIRDPALVRSLLTEVDAVVHLAGIVGYPACDADPINAKTTNVEGTKVLASLIKPGIRLIHASSCSVYGFVREGMPDETYPALPLTLYGASKLEAEDIVTGAGGINLRFSTLYGPSRRFRRELLIHTFCELAVTAGKLTLYDPGAIRPFVHINDAVEAIVFALHSNAGLAGVYNVGSEASTISKLEIAQKIARLCAMEIEADKTQTDPDGRNYQVSFRKINETGFKVAHTFDSGLPSTLEFIREQVGSRASAERASLPSCRVAYG